MWETLDAISDPLAWLAIAAFLFTMLADLFDRERVAVNIGVIAWISFAVFWLSMFPYFYFEFQSPIQSVLSLAAVPLCLVAAYHLHRGRTSLLLLSRAVGLMGLIYLPAMLYEPFTQWLIETVAYQTHVGMELLGYTPGIEEGQNGYMSRFAFDGYSTYIILACTGIGSMAIFGGLIAATDASWGRKLLGIGLAVSIIWILNLARNVFVGLAAPLGWFDYPALEALTLAIAGPGMRNSYFISHNVISQGLAVVALVGIAYLCMRIVPEILDVLDEALFVITGSEYDLRTALDQPAVRADGGNDEGVSE